MSPDSTTSRQVPFKLPLNAHATGIILKEILRRQLLAIRAQRLIFEAMPKVTPGRTDDLLTSADLASQDIFRKLAAECFEGIGIIAEEENLKVPCTIEGVELHLISDPLDGTKAFKRRQSGGVASQLALVMRLDGQLRVLAAYVGDVNTMEIYGYRPGTNVHRLTDLSLAENLSDLDRDIPLSTQFAATRQHPDSLHPLIRDLVKPGTGLVKGLVVDNGSASLTAARTWKGEMGISISEAIRDTPWDMAPVLGINDVLGFEAWTPTVDGRSFEKYDYQLSLDSKTERPTIIWVHRSRAFELNTWAEQLT